MALDLEAIELIKQLKHRYFRCLDSADLDGVRACFTDDISIDYKGGSYHAKYDNVDDIMAFLEQSFHSEAAAMHTGHHPEITVADDGQTATGLWYLQDIFYDLKYKVITQGVALYEDRYVKTADGWRIQHSGYNRVWELVEELGEGKNFTFRRLSQTGKVLASKRG